MALARLLALFATLCLADLSDLGQKKLETMKKLRAASTNGIIEFTAQNYK